MKGIANPAMVFTQPNFAISMYKGSKIASTGIDINAITRVRINPLPLNFIFAKAYPAMEPNAKSPNNTTPI